MKHHRRQIFLLRTCQLMSRNKQLACSLPSMVLSAPYASLFERLIVRILRKAQVKVMWPRNDASAGPGADMNASRRAKSSGLSGFVSYMKRKDAETALRELDGFSWNGSILRVGWSKAVSLPARPIYGREVAFRNSHRAHFTTSERLGTKR
jgi:hypothetical protein